MITFDKYQRIFREKATEVGYSAEEVERCLQYAQALLDNGVPVIYNTSNLASLVGYDKKYLKRAAAYTSYFYKEHSIPKSSGGQRKIHEPLPSLKEIQTWIAHAILSKIKISRYAKAYTNGRSIKDHIRFHKNQKVVITLDIRNFFTNIKFQMVENIFVDLGYSNIISNLLTKLCCYKDSLPQGAPTSPVISNIIMRPLDDRLAEYCRVNELKYSRYADDLAFSGNEIARKELEQVISKTLRQIGPLRLYKKKTMTMRNNQRQVISGIIVNSKGQVPREKRDELRQAIYYIEKFGLEDHLKQIDCTRANYLKHLLGLANYITFINPKDEKTKAIKAMLYSMLSD